MDINNIELRDLLEVAEEKGLAIDIYEGTLLDNYIIYNSNVLEIKGKSPEYIILKEKYLNSQSSITEIILTDDYSDVDEFIEYCGGYDEED